MTGLVRVRAGFPILVGIVLACLFVVCGSFPQDRAERLSAAEKSPPATTDGVCPINSLAMTSEVPRPKPSNNTLCLNCHRPFRRDTLSTHHAEEGIGCVDCHGKSIAHMGDDKNTKLPDVLFQRKQIHSFCVDCHEEEKHPDGYTYQAFLKKWLGKTRPNGRVVTNESACTDCHGMHTTVHEEKAKNVPVQLTTK